MTVNVRFEQVKRTFIGPILFLFMRMVKVLSSLYSCNISPKILQEHGYKSFAISDDFVPPLTSKAPQLSFEDLLKKAIEEGQPIKPVMRKKPFTAPIDCCPSCRAPQEFLYSFGFDPKTGLQKVQCKVCKAQPTPGKKTKEKATLYCPHCGRAIAWKKKRKDFIVYKCVNTDCSYRKTKGKRYTYNKYLIDESDLVTSSPAKPKVNLERSHFSSFLQAKSLAFSVNFGLSLRQAAALVKEVYSVALSRQTISNWIESFAALLHPLIHRIHLPLSHLVIVDETYVRVNGKWGYLFTAIDGIDKFIITQHFSMNRDARAAMTLLYKLCKIHNNQEFILVTDKAPIYAVAVNYVNYFLDQQVCHRQVKGLSEPEGTPTNPYRKYKNIVERYFGSYKAHYKRKKSFQSVNGVVAYSILYKLYYNHLKPHESLGHNPPLPLSFRGKKVDNWKKLINYILDLEGQ